MERDESTEDTTVDVRDIYDPLGGVGLVDHFTRCLETGRWGEFLALPSGKVVDN